MDGLLRQLIALDSTDAHEMYSLVQGNGEAVNDRPGSFFVRYLVITDYHRQALSTK